MNKPTGKTIGRTRGFILFTVLGTLSLLTAIMVSTRLNTASIVSETRMLTARHGLPSLAMSGFETAAAEIMARTDPAAQVSGSFADRQAGDTITGRFVNNAGRVDLNAAPPELLQAALAAAGVPVTDVVTLAGRIIDWRDDDGQRLTDGASESIDYGSNRNSGPRNKPFQSVLELAQVPGFDAGLVRQMMTRVTVGSGIPTVHPDLLSPDLLLNVPGILPTTRSRLQALVAVEGKSTDSVADIAGSDPVLGNLVSTAQSRGWHVTETISTGAGIEEIYEGDIALLANDPRPFRILSFSGPLDRID